MPRRFVLALALTSALTGCVAAPPTGPLVEYRDGQEAVTRTVACEANYVLVARDTAAAPGPFGEHHLRKGECVGFRRESDGSLTAVAPGYTLALPPGSYSWEVVPGSVPPLRERQWRAAREYGLATARVAGITILAVMVVLGVVFIVVVSRWNFS